MYLTLFLCIEILLLCKAADTDEHKQNIIPKKRMDFRDKTNVCRRMEFYFSGATNTFECWYNPDLDSFAHDIIKRYGYTFQAYKVISNDSYITTLFRIPNGKTKPDSNATKSGTPVFLLHGLASSSHVMLDIGKDCLAFALADAGYDVWIGNLRGSSYSLGHRNLTYRNQEYWKFSFHEMGKYDLPANVDFIAKHTDEKKIIFIGHSIAASVFHVFEDYHRSLSKEKLAGAVLIAPVVYLSNLGAPQKAFVQLGNPIMVLAILLGIKNNSTTAGQVLNVKRQLCHSMPPYLQACNNGFYLAFGLFSENIPAHYVPLMMVHNPSGFSVNTFNHLLQITHSEGNFQEYDYGVQINQELYDDVFPRDYDVQGCETPVAIFHSEGDWISTEEDVQKLADTIPKEQLKGVYKIKSKLWKHMDYFYGKKPKQLFYGQLFKTVKDLEGSASNKNNTNDTKSDSNGTDKKADDKNSEGGSKGNDTKAGDENGKDDSKTTDKNNKDDSKGVDNKGNDKKDKDVEDGDKDTNKKGDDNKNDKTPTDSDKSAQSNGKDDAPTGESSDKGGPTIETDKIEIKTVTRIHIEYMTTQKSQNSNEDDSEAAVALKINT